MAIAKRLFLFLAVNILVITTINITLRLLGINSYITARGIDYRALLSFCALWGFIGSFISLMISRWMAKMAYGIQVIDPARPGSQAERLVLETVHRMARKAGITTMPEVGIYPSPEVNAFATGYSKNHALVAVSAGLLDHMSEQELEGVLGHEMAHVSNGDMVTMALIQGVVNTFVLFFSKIAAFALSSALRRDDDRGGYSLSTFFFEIIFQIAFSLLGAVVVAFFSRWREFRADAGGAQFAGRDKMIGALSSLKRYRDAIETEHASYQTLKISGKRTGGLISLLATHPDLDLRIQRLQHGR